MNDLMLDLVQEQGIVDIINDYKKQMERSILIGKIIKEVEKECKAQLKILITIRKIILNFNILIPQSDYYNTNVINETKLKSFKKYMIVTQTMKKFDKDHILKKDDLQEIIQIININF